MVVRQLRALIFTVACVVGAVLGTAGATYAGQHGTERVVAAAPAPGVDQGVPVASATQPDASAASPAGPGEPADGPDASADRPRYAETGGAYSGSVMAGTGYVASAPPEHRPIIATAVRHVPSMGELGPVGGPDPIANKAMVLLVGWVMLVLLGGGVLAGRRTR
jgi:hypothetical protein